jgi:hypothetical protein
MCGEVGSLGGEVGIGDDFATKLSDFATPKNGFATKKADFAKLKSDFATLICHLLGEVIFWCGKV